MFFLIFFSFFQVSVVVLAHTAYSNVLYMYHENISLITDWSRFFALLPGPRSGLANCKGKLSERSFRQRCAVIQKNTNGDNSGVYSCGAYYC